MKNNTPKKGGALRTLLLIALIALFCFSAYKVGSQLLTEHKEQGAFDELLAEIGADRPTRQVPATRTPKPAQETETPESTGQEPAMQDNHTDESDALEAMNTTALSGMETGPEQPMTTGTTSEFTLTPEPETTPEPTSTLEPTPTQEPTPTPEPTEVPPMLEAYEKLYRRNHDIFGWITIEGTKVDLPVMYTPRDPEYYLHKSFNKTYAYSGVPFMDAACFPGCGNYIIYGHHMKNGTMFAAIVGYAKESYWEEHPLIYFDTLYEMGTYEIVAAFYSRVFQPEETDVFRYFWYTDLRDPEVFDEYIAQVREGALYDTGVEVEYGDQLITLSTCEYTVKDNRFVVVARKIE